MQKQYKFLDLVLGAFVAVLIISNIASAAKITSLGAFTFDAGTILFPLSYIFSDMLTEVYGFKAARRVTWIGFGALLLMTLTFYVVGQLPGESEWLAGGGADAYGRILGLVPRIALGSLVAYLCGSFVNDIVLAKLKVATAGKHLWLRTIGSTLVGQIVDTLVFCLIAFYGELPNDVLWTIIVSNYVFKVLVEVLFTPVTYALVNAMKRAEGVDVFDRNESFNPFGMRA